MLRGETEVGQLDHSPPIVPPRTPAETSSLQWAPLSGYSVTKETLVQDESKPICFVLSPIGEDGSPERAAADKVLKHLVRKALGDKYEVTRADGDTNPGAITSRIVSSIMEAALVVADLSGYNPNVFYELAIAHGFRKPVVHIQRAGERAAFDVKDMRTVRYDISDPDLLESAQGLLTRYAQHAVNQPETVETPLSSSLKFAELEASTDPVAESNVQVIEALKDLHTEVRRLARRPAPNNRTGTDETRALRRIITRILQDNRAVPSDFADSITPATSADHDDWLRQGLEQIAPGTSVGAKNRVLYDAATARQFGYGDEDDDFEDLGEINGHDE